MSLAAAVSDSGLALWLGQQLAPLNAWGTAALVIASVALVIFLTELTGNLATAATLLPVMGAIAVQAGVPQQTAYQQRTLQVGAVQRRAFQLGLAQIEALGAGAGAPLAEKPAGGV